MECGHSIQYPVIPKQEHLKKWNAVNVKALYCIGENPLMADVHMNHTKTIA